MLFQQEMELLPIYSRLLIFMEMWAHLISQNERFRHTLRYFLRGTTPPQPGFRLLLIFKLHSRNYLNGMLRQSLFSSFSPFSLSLKRRSPHIPRGNRGDTYKCFTTSPPDPQVAAKFD